MLREICDGTTAEILDVGVRVRLVRHTEITGTISAHEVQKESGKLSAIPYKIAWDNDDAAYRVLGWLFLYATTDMVEQIP